MLLRVAGVVGALSLVAVVAQQLREHDDDGAQTVTMEQVGEASAAAQTAPVHGEEAQEDLHSQAELSSYLAMPKHVRWQKAAHLFLDGPESCVDGRDPNTVVGTPGGDAGEFILALSVIETLTGHTFSQTEVDTLLAKHIEAFGGFYMHTDEHAQHAVQQRLEQVTDTPDGVPIDQIVRTPPPELEPQLLDILLETSSIGCGHLRLIAKRPNDYGVRPELVRTVMRAFFHSLWSEQQGTRFVVLEGGHREAAVVNVHVPQPLHPFSRIPLVEPRDGDFEMFVYHPEVTDWLRHEHAAFYLEHLPWLTSTVGESQLIKALDENAHRHLSLTIEALASGLPTYDVIATAHGLEVREVGHL